MTKYYVNLSQENGLEIMSELLIAAKQNDLQFVLDPCGPIENWIEIGRRNFENNQANFLMIDTGGGIDITKYGPQLNEMIISKDKALEKIREI